jgi:hypothetical protein
MPRLLSPDDACIGVDVPTYAGKARYDGRSVDVSDPSHVKALRGIGYTVADVSGRPSKAAGFECACGFSSFFKLCSRCGAECVRPDLVA